MPTTTTTPDNEQVHLRYPDLNRPTIILPKEKEIKFQLEPFGILRTDGEFLPICIEVVYDKLLISYYMNLLSAYPVVDLNDALNRLPADTFISNAPNIRRVLADLAEEKLPDAWIYLCRADVKHKGGEELIYMSLNEHVVVSTMELFIRDSNNPTWQNIRVRYHRNLYNLIHNRPKVSLSMQGFIRRFFNREATDEELKDIYEMFIVPDLERNNLDLDSLEFHYIQGDEPNAADVITKAYTNVDRRCDTWGDYYPSPIGSCMRHTEWYVDYDMYDTNDHFYIGTTDQCDYSHPVVAYATKDIGFAWLTDSNGLTVARTLVNLTASDENYAGLPTAVRVYACCLSSDPDETTRKEHWDEMAEHLIVKLEAHLGHPVSVDEDRGLLDCTVKPQYVEEDLWVAPYIDGDHKSVDLDTFRVIGCGYKETYGRTLTCNEHNPPVAQETLGSLCRQCRQLLSHDERLVRVAEGVWMCPRCAAERHEANA